LSSDLKIQFLSNEEIKVKAADFLSRFHPDNSIPVPIEEIVEFDLGINIIPMHGLRKAFEIDGFISSDLHDITVDDSVSELYPSRYRFTLAHEVGHIILHKELFVTAKFSNYSDWKSFVNNISEVDYKKLEWQANAFAGLVLVPAEHLEVAVKSCVEKIIREGIDLKANWDFGWNLIASHICGDFQVSPPVIERRIKFENLSDFYR